MLLPQPVPSAGITVTDSSSAGQSRAIRSVSDSVGRLSHLRSHQLRGMRQDHCSITVPAPSGRDRRLLHDRDGALSDERDGHQVGAHAVARDAAGGVRRRAARGVATIFRDATLTAGFGPRRTYRPRRPSNIPIRRRSPTAASLSRSSRTLRWTSRRERAPTDLSSVFARPIVGSTTSHAGGCEQHAHDGEH
jgi:hypothetical protein